MFHKPIITEIPILKWYKGVDKPVDKVITPISDKSFCSTCSRWEYNRWTEEKYGMGVGVCELDGQPAFCDRSDCDFHCNTEVL